MRSAARDAFPFDVAGWLTPAEGAALSRLASGRRVLEIGSYCGRSTICLARTAEHVVSVDPHDGRCTPAPRGTFDEFLANLARYGVAERVTAMVGLAADFPLRASGPFDLAFIDGAHDGPSVLADLEAARGALAEGGTLAFHDYGDPAYPAVTELVHVLVAAGAGPLSVTDSLAVIRP